MMAIENLQRIVPPLTEWFRAFARDLPWRSDPLPYYVWISEIMLQQTRVEAVKPYFRRFTEALPDVKALADCPEEELFKLWEGLGYYSRARNLKKAAQEIVRSFGGEIPGDYEALLSLPGIGSYTAGAIASIAFRVPVSAVDGNVLRVVSRLTGSGKVIDDPRVKRFWEEQLTGLIRESGVDSGLFNQAMMELGALICLPNGKPDCSSCPLKACCRACAEGSWERIPARREKKGSRSLIIAGAWDLKSCRSVRFRKRSMSLPMWSGICAAIFCWWRICRKRSSPVSLRQSVSLRRGLMRSGNGIPFLPPSGTIWIISACEPAPTSLRPVCPRQERTGQPG